MKKFLFIVLFLVFVISLVSLFLDKKGINIPFIQKEEVVLPEENLEEEAVFCTMDAMMCPDGSYVGRVAPDCEFEACSTPEVSE